MQESNVFSPVATTLADFERTHLVEGDALARRVTSSLVCEVDGFARNAELSGLHTALRRLAPSGAIETVPLVSAWAISGGPLETACVDALIDRLTARLSRAHRQRALDGVVLALHGAMCARGERDPEARILRSVRAVVGRDVPIACTFDLHGLLTREKMAELDYLAAYRTNPHRDHAHAGFRAGRMLIDALFRPVRPARAWRSLPMIGGGGAGVDFLPPLARIFRLMKRFERDPRVVDASLFACHPWNDHPELGWSVAVFASTADHAERLADQLAEAAWSVRNVAPPIFDDVESALRKVRRSRLARALGTVCVCDASDVVGAGGTGENTHLLSALLDASDLKSYVPLRDPVAVSALWGAPRGAEVCLAVGGRLDPTNNSAVVVRGRVHAQRATAAFGRVVALDLGAVQLVLTEAPPLVMKPSFYMDVGLNPWRADVCVVKSFFPFRIFFAAHARMALYVRTRGVTDFDRALGLRFAGPVHPQSMLADWRAEDRRRRGLAWHEGRGVVAENRSMA